MNLSKRQLCTSPFTLGLVFFYLFALLFSGCSQQEQPPRKKQPYPDLPKLTIGLIPEQDIFTQKKRYEPLMAYLSEMIGIPIEINIMSRYGNIVENFNKLNLDGAFFGSFTGALAIQKLKVEPLARPQNIGGSSTYYGMVFVKKGSGIRTAADMRNKQLVLVDRATTAGFLLPLAYFRSIEIEDYKSWFKEYYFSGTHEDAINDVLSGKADIGAAKNTVFYRMAQQDNQVTRGLEILATSPHVPENGLAVRHDLPEGLKQTIQKTLLEMDQHRKGREILERMRIEKFILTTQEDYLPVLDYASSLGIDFKTYNYFNN